MSKGTLHISPYPNETDKGPLNRYICLRGYPAPITVQFAEENGMKENSCHFEAETEYLTRLSDLTIREVEAYD